MHHPDPWPEGLPAPGPSELDDRFLDLPDHGRAWLSHAAARTLGRLGTLAQSVVSVEDLSAFRGADGPRGPYCDRGRMADHGDRTPALGGLWRDADEGRGHEPLCARTFDNADRVHRDVCGRLRHRHQLHAQAGSERPAVLRRAFAGAEPTKWTSDTSSIRGPRPHRSGDRVAGQEEIAAMGIDLPVIWAVIIGFGLMMYVVMDGFDLGIGILFPFIRDRRDRDTMVNTVAPVWDGNETWLVLGGATLMGVFPLAYSVLLSALYVPIFFMLAGLIWRGVAFEFRFKADEAHRPFWDKAFAWGSYVATFSQGVALGAFINGFKVTGASYDGGSFDWLSPFSLFTGVGLIVAYALLGCTWLIMKTEGELQHRLKALAPPVTLVLVAAIVVVSVWTPLTHPSIATRWFSFPNIIIFSPVPVLVVATTWVMMRVLRNETHASPFLLALLLLFLGYTGLAISLWPNIIPPAMSIREAAGPPESMGFTLVGALFVIPFILAYTAMSYYVFRGKVRAGEGYRGLCGADPPAH